MLFPQYCCAVWRLRASDSSPEDPSEGETEEDAGHVWGMIFYSPIRHVMEETKVWHLGTLRWTITLICFILFMYKACECINQYMQLETVTKHSEERQEKYPLPQVCISQAEIQPDSLRDLNISSRGYRYNGQWSSNVSDMTEEEIYLNLSTKFEDIVQKLVVDVLRKDNDNYDKIIIFEKGSVIKDIDFTYCDYYYSLQCFCINLPKTIQERAIQKLYVYMKKNAHIAIVAPGNYYGYERKRNEIYTEVGFSYRYQVYHRLTHSLPIGPDPCHLDTEWEGDECTLKFLNDLIFNQLNCTTPWLLSFARYILYFERKEAHNLC